MHLTKRFVLLTCLLGSAGCATQAPTAPSTPALPPVASAPTPVPMDGKVFGSQIARGLVSASPRALRAACMKHAETLYRQQRFDELDKFLDELGKQDPLQTVCTPSYVTYMLLESPPDLARSAWKQHLAERWTETGTDKWARLGYVSAFVVRSGLLKRFAQYQPEAPAFKTAVRMETFVGQTSSSAKIGSRGHEFLEWAYRCYSLNQKTSLYPMLVKHPRELLLHYSGVYAYRDVGRDQHISILGSVKKRSDSAYALFFTMLAPSLSADEFRQDAWDWATLRKGFEQLLQESPNATEVRNAYALAAAYAGEREVLAQQLGALGYHWDPAVWQTLSNYRKSSEGIPDYHVSSSSLTPVPAVGAAQKENLAESALALLERHQWEALEELLGALSGARERNAVYEALRNIGKDDAEFVRREALLLGWLKERPDSGPAHVLLGDFYVEYAWHARGRGFSDTVTPEGWKLFGERLERAAQFFARAEQLGHDEIVVLQGQMKICYGHTGDKKLAERLALRAGSKGMDYWPVMSGWAQMLLPRWHGEPGDLQRAGDALRKHVGHDGFYAILGYKTVEVEGLECLQPGHPSYVDWNRALASLAELHRSGSLSAGVPQRYLRACEEMNRKKDAARILPLLAEHYDLETWESQERYEASRNWARGKGGWPLEPAQVRWKSAAPRHQKANKLVVLGFTGELVRRPPGVSFHGMVRVSGPNSRRKDGTTFSVLEHPLDVFATDPPAIGCALQADFPGEFAPGEWTVTYLEDGEEVHSEVFHLDP